MFKKGDIIKLKPEMGGWYHCGIEHDTLITVTDILFKDSNELIEECARCESFDCVGYCYKLDYNKKDSTLQLNLKIYDGSGIDASFALDKNSLREKKIKRIIF